MLRFFFNSYKNLNVFKHSKIFKQDKEFKDFFVILKIQYFVLNIRNFKKI